MIRCGTVDFVPGRCSLRIQSTLRLAILAAACGCSRPDAQAPSFPARQVAPAAPADVASALLLDRVLAERIDLDLASAADGRDRLLWSSFANAPYEKQFSGISTKDWFRTSGLYRARLLDRAAANGLDAASLGRAIDVLEIREADAIATVPVGAFAARDGADDVWIVVAKWEEADPYTDDTTGSKEWSSLGHIWIVAVRSSDGRAVGRSRCK